MTAKNVESFLVNMQKKAKHHAEKAGTDVFYTATFINGKSHRKVLLKMNAKQLGKQVKSFLEVETPEKIKIDMFTSEGTFIDMNVCEVISQQPPLQPPVAEGFRGFGEAEINSIVDQRMAEKQRAVEHEELKEAVKQLSFENDELQTRVDELEDQNTELENKLEAKQKLSYYSGMLGDILESFGIQKSKIKKPIAELMGIDDEKDGKSANNQEQKNAALPAKEDNSGIVEEHENENSKEQQRQEAISLINSFLNSLSNQMLVNVFTIFSDIEHDHSLADEILEFIAESKKEETDDNA